MKDIFDKTELAVELQLKSNYSLELTNKVQIKLQIASFFDQVSNNLYSY